ncbi:MAG: ABC transporter permease [Acidimicrobiaceae bacterium]|nr:ABC transporter permease [Acidimicrobiaceae bacterium]
MADISAKLTPAVRTSVTLIVNFAKRETKTLYKRSILGWLWSLIRPLSTVLIYSLVFGVIYRAAPPEILNCKTEPCKAESFALYLFSGLVIWNLFTAVVTGSMQWLKGVNELRKKVYFPTETAILGGAVSVFLQSLLEILVLAAIMIILGNISWTFVYLLWALVLAAMFGLGIGFVVSIFNARYRDIEYLMGILLNIAFFLVPIVFVPDMVPEEAYGLPVKALMNLNPITTIVGISHDAVYFLNTPSIYDMITSSAWAGAAFAVGLMYFRRRSMQISEEP